MMLITSWSSLIFVGFLFTAKASKDCTSKPTDLVFVLDESKSVGDINFQLQNQFVAKFVEGFDIGINKTQVAVITFSTGVVVEFYLNAFHDKIHLLESIKHINYSHSGLTMTNRALNAVRNDVLTEANGMRPDASPFVIVLTDGKSMSFGATLKEAKLLNDMNVTVFAIGISNEVNEVELRRMASDPKDVIIVKDFGSLMSIRKQALNGACEAIKKKNNDYTSMQVTADTIFTTSKESLASTMPTKTNFEEKCQSFELIEYSSKYNCDFENVSLCCLLLHLPNSNTSWIIGNETTIANVINGTNDHTFHNTSGQFAYVFGSSMQHNNTACISTQIMHSTQNQTVRLQFYFQMFGNDTKTLKVYTTNGSLSLEDAMCIWQISMNSTNDWSFAHAEVNLSSTGRIVFEAMTTGDGNGFAIDDITLSAWRYPYSSTNIATSTLKILTKSSTTSIQKTRKTTATNQLTYPVVTNVYSSTDNGYWTESSSLPPNIVFHSRKPLTQPYITSSQTTQTTTTRTTTSDPPTMHSVAIPTYFSTDNVYWTDSSSTYPSNFALFGQGTSTFTSDKSTKTSTRITNAFNAILSKTIPTRTSNSHNSKKTVTTNPITMTTKNSNKNTSRFTRKLISNTRSTTPSVERTSTSVLNSKLSHSQSRFSISGYFQFIEVGVIAITVIVGMGLLGCCCLKFCGGKRSEDDDEDKKKEKEAKSIQPAWKGNHRNPISKPNRWTDDF